VFGFVLAFLCGLCVQGCSPFSGVWMRLPDIIRRLLAQPVRSGLVLAVLIEGVTCFNRFVLGLRAKDHLDLLTAPTMGLRVHHGHVGLFLIAVWAGGRLVARLRRGRGASGGREGPWLAAALALGIGLAVSDAVHHLLVLWPLTGSPEFP
jgi:hypothetical protein